MNKQDYIGEQLRLNGYNDMSDYIDRRGNEILSDEVWVWRLKSGVENDFPGLALNEVICILKKIMLDIVNKGGVIVDYSGGDVEKIINKYKDDSSNRLIEEVSNFIYCNPDYGSDGNGVWFE